MAKRPYCLQLSGDRKKAKLDFTISDHNFPLSQSGQNKEPEQNTWGDDNDDEILLLASQACEDAYNDMSSLPDYSMCMQPTSTSTQLFDPGPSTSKTTFNFKTPSAVPHSVVTSNLKNKCNRISSPLPGISMKVSTLKNNFVDVDESFKILKGQDSDLVYKQLLQLQEENAKLKSENGKLLEKCVTKEGEASILRSQLKTSQVAVDNARMEKIKAQEKVQMEWTEKLSAANNQMHELQTQLDFKNLEMISIKERCKLMESNKVKLTQVTVPTNDISSSQRCNNNSFIVKDTSIRRPQVSSSSVQTEDKAHFLRLNKTCRTKPLELSRVLRLIIEPTASQHSLLEYNEKLQKHIDLSQNKCRVYSTFHRIQSSSANSKGVDRAIGVGNIYEELTSIAAGTDDGKALGNILSAFMSTLREVESQLELVSRKVTTAFQKEMDEKYIDASNSYLVITEEDLLRGKPLYKEEQVIPARRMAAALSYLGGICRTRKDMSAQLMDIITNICKLLDSTSCAILYSGFLLSITRLIPHLRGADDTKIRKTLKYLISSRPMTFVCSELLVILKEECLLNGLEEFCPKSKTGNLRLDYDQGVLLYKKDSCFIQVLLKQAETSLKCIEKQNLTAQAVDTTARLIALHSNVNRCHTPSDCNCHLTLLQVLVYALRILAVMLKMNPNSKDAPSRSRVLAVCSSGVSVLHGALRGGEHSAQLAHDEGHLMEFMERVASERTQEPWASMVAELASSFQTFPEESPSSYHRQPWLNSFQNFTITD